MIIIIPTLFNKYLGYCLDSVNKSVIEPISINLSIGYDNFAKSCNSSFSNINGEHVKWVLFLNDDILIRNNFIRHMLDTADRLNADIVGAKLIYGNDTIQHAGVYFNSNCMPYHYKINKPNEYIEDRIVPAVTGACMMVKYDVFKDIGGFDDGYINCFEDIDLCLKANDAGYVVALCGKTDIFHYEKSTRKFNKDEFEYNKARLMGRWENYIKSLYTVQ